jgi:sec-independent protein translocase protein TatA
MELLIVLGVAVLLFGKRLPEVGRYLGRGIIEFRKGIRGIEDEVRTIREATNTDLNPEFNASPRVEPTVPKFESPTSSPVPNMEYEPQPTQD